MGILIRVAFNNQNWAGRCKNVKNDKRLLKCQDQTYKTGYKVDKNGDCSSNCWESNLCTKYLWGNLENFRQKEKAQGTVWFFYTSPDNSLVLWGKSKVKKVEDKKIYFEKFNPLPEESRIRVSSKELLGTKWGQRTYRYTNPQIESKLKELMKPKDDSFNDSIETVITDKEGRRSLRKHLVKERSNKLVSKFKQHLSSYKCCICGFNFEETYGEIGAGFIEVHHKKPVSDLKEDEQISTKDLIAVCSNCHRMLHRKKDNLLKDEELKKMILQKRKERQ